jgi:hypothetical protein
MPNDRIHRRGGAEAHERIGDEAMAVDEDPDLPQRGLNARGAGPTLHTHPVQSA